MSTVHVKKLNETTFEVMVQDSTPTTHTVSVMPDYAAKLSGGQITVEQLIIRSFEFLLERESNTSILRSFDLPVIARYFPEYERTMITLLKAH
ncbi:MAG TPA: hypothetical protein VIE69_04155 [Methylophilaceae bacterium]|jgi:hypothetical protein